ncbi:MAG: uncharacterized protein QOK39_2271 [Acidimicrobiaceae bacterium]|jgi:uncharacterized protein YcaQ|nr:uncharacterized protein [Acidimicrobiaceae bacterium]
MRRLTRVEARRIAVRAQLLDAARPTDLLTVAEHLTMLQLDPTAIVAPSADLVAWSRIGNTYQPIQLQHALERDRSMFEHRAQDVAITPNINMVRPTSHLGLYLAEMEKLRTRPGQVRTWLDANAGFERRVLDRLRDSGPLTSRQIPDTAEVAWISSGWTHDRNVTQLLEFLASRGIVAVAGRAGKQRLWDLAERVYPASIEALPVEEAQRIRDLNRLRALGIARPKMVGEAGIPVEVEGTPRPWRLDPDTRADDLIGRTAVLSPFDRLIHDRARAEELFGFEYGIELYKPKAKRRWGYFAMPVLDHDQLVGKVDVAADRDTSCLIVHALQEDIPFTQATSDGLTAELEALAAWLGLGQIRWPS